MFSTGPYTDTTQTPPTRIGWRVEGDVVTCWDIVTGDALGQYAWTGDALDGPGPVSPEHRQDIAALIIASAAPSP